MMTKFLLVVFVGLSALAVVQCFDTDAWFMINDYLESKTQWAWEDENLKYAGYYLEDQERFGKNPNLKTALKFFLTLKDLTKSEPSCDGSEYQTYESCSEFIDRGFYKDEMKRVIDVFNRVLNEYQRKCDKKREVDQKTRNLSNTLTEKLENPKVEENSEKIDVFMKELILDELYPDEQFHKDLDKIPKANQVYTTLLQYEILFESDKQKMKKILENCKNSKYYANTPEDQLLETCVLKPCRKYNDDVYDIFSTAKTYNYKARDIDNPNEKNIFMYQWAKTKICTKLVRANTKRPKYRYPATDYNSQSYSNYGSSGVNHHSSGGGGYHSSGGGSHRSGITMTIAAGIGRR